MGRPIEFSPIPANAKDITGDRQRLLSSIPEFSTVQNSDIRTVISILDMNALKGLSFEQKRALFVYYIWHKKPGKVDDRSRLGISDKLKLDAISVVSQSEELISRYDRLVEMVPFVRRVQRRMRKVPSITEFDYWVYGVWLATAEPLKTLVEHIPGEFGYGDLSAKERKKKVDNSMQRLKEYGEVDMGFRVRREKLRQEKIVQLVRNEGLLPWDDLARINDVSKAAIRSDLSILRKSNILEKGMPSKKKKELVGRIVAILRSLDGQNTSIGPAEITRRLNASNSGQIYDRHYIGKFMRNNSELLGISAPKKM